MNWIGKRTAFLVFSLAVLSSPALHAETTETVFEARAERVIDGRYLRREHPA